MEQPTFNHLDVIPFNMNMTGTLSGSSASWFGISALFPGYIDVLYKKAYNTTDITTIGAMDPLMVLSCQLRVVFRNACNSDVELDIWRCTARRNLPFFTGNQCIGFNPGLLSDGFSEVKKLAQQTESVPLADANATPYMSADWVQMFKLKKHASIKLRPGDTHTLKWRISRIQTFKKANFGIDDLSSFTASYYYTKECGKLFLIRARGSLVHDEAKVQETMVNTSLTTRRSEFNLDCIREHRFQALYQPNNTLDPRYAGADLLLDNDITGNQQWTDQLPSEGAFGV
jgi:hypothetical protein